MRRKALYCLQPYSYQPSSLNNENDDQKDQNKIC